MKKISPACFAMNALLVGLIFFAAYLTIHNALAAKPSDNGIWSSAETRFQGFNLVYAPTQVPAVVAYWYTFSEDGRQAWFISEAIPVGSDRTENVANLFKPICSFVDNAPECSVGDPVGVIGVRDQGENIVVRFGIKDLDGFSPECSSFLRQAVLPSPPPPPFDSQIYPCQGSLELSRISPAIPELQ